MAASDRHLELALEEYNDKVNILEDGEPSSDLLDAYINRGSILMMMEYYTASESDYTDAIELMPYLSSRGITIDVGTVVKAHVSRGELLIEKSTEEAVEDYAVVSDNLGNLVDGSRYFDNKNIVLMCIAIAEDLLDYSYPDMVQPFVDKAMSLLITKDDLWSRNRFLEVLNINAQSFDDREMEQEALSAYGEAFDVGQSLLEKGELEDIMSIIFPLASKADLELKLDMKELYVSDRNGSIVLVEQAMKAGKIDDIELLKAMHREIANVYFSMNKMKEAEEHLMKEVVLNVDGAKDYIRKFVDRR